MFAHSQLATSWVVTNHGISMSPSVSTPVAVPNTNLFYVKLIFVCVKDIEDP